MNQQQFDLQVPEVAGRPYQTIPVKLQSGEIAYLVKPNDYKSQNLTIS